MQKENIYEVYYRKHPTFFPDKKLTRDDVLCEQKFAYIKTVQAKSTNHVFEMFQAGHGESVWKPENVKHDNRMVVEKEVFHTSMSVGDCVYDAAQDVLYQCESIGWAIVER